MQGPFGVAGAQAMMPGLVDRTWDADPVAVPGGSASVPLGQGGIPQRFVSVGVALTVAYAALGDADGVRVAGALGCAATLLFPNDEDGFTAASRVATMAVRHLEPIEEPTMADTAVATLAMQRRVMGAAESLDRAYLASANRLQMVNVDAVSWRLVTGGIGPVSDQIASAFGPFLPGLVRFSFFTAVALDYIRRDDWAWVGAALIAARSDVHRGADGMQALRPLG